MHAKFIRILFLLFVSTSLSAAEKKTLPYLGSSQGHEMVLENDLKILVLEDHSSPTFTYQTWFNVGSRDEEKGLTGLAHLFEHMMFKATKNRKLGEFDKILESAGAEGENAFTSHDYTGYVQSLPASSSNLDLIASLEADRMVNLIVDDKTLDTEREVVQNERRFRNENSPDGKLWEALFDVAFEKHSYHWPVIGYAEDLAAAKSPQCMEFYKKHYAPNNATVVVVGDVSADKVFSLVEKYYGSLPAVALSKASPPAEAPQPAERIKKLNLNIAVEKLMMGYKIANIANKDIYPLLLAQNILGGGKSSRLHKKLVDGGIATEVGIEAIEAKDPSLFLVSINMQKGRKADEALAVVNREVSTLAAKPVSKVELERALAQFELSLFTGQQNNMSRARFLGFYETVAGDFSVGPKTLDELGKVSAKDVQKAVSKYLTKKNRTLIYGVPEKKGA